MRKRGEAEGDEVPGSVHINKHLPNATAEPQGAPVLHAAPRCSTHQRPGANLQPRAAAEPRGREEEETDTFQAPF